MDPQTRDLLPSLDPRRDYGPLGYNGVLQRIENGELELRPSESRHPVIWDRQKQVVVKGSASLPAGNAADRRELGRRFVQYAQEDFEWAYANLKVAIEKQVSRGDVSGLKLFLNYGLGTPPRTEDPQQQNAIAALLMEALKRQPEQAHVFVDDEKNVISIQARELD